MADNYYGKAFEAASPTPTSSCCARPARGETPPPVTSIAVPAGHRAINDTLKTQLDLERHGGRTIAGVASRVRQRIRPHRCDLAQRPTRPAHATFANRLRSLNLGITIQTGFA